MQGIITVSVQSVYNLFIEPLISKKYTDATKTCGNLLKSRGPIRPQGRNIAAQRLSYSRCGIPLKGMGLEEEITQFLNDKEYIKEISILLLAGIHLNTYVRELMPHTNYRKN